MGDVSRLITELVHLQSFTSDIEKNTIVTLDPFMQLSLGGANLTFRDRKLANAMYECDGTCRHVGRRIRREVSGTIPTKYLL